MSSKIKTLILILFSILLVILCIFIFYLGRKSIDIPEVITEIKWDTVHIEKPVPYKVESIETEYVYLPKLIFLSDNSNSKVDTTSNEFSQTDSIQIPIQIERKVYKDERYKAIISGPRVGDFSPTLDTLDLYLKTETKITERPVPFIRPYISACGGNNILGIGVGISIKQKIDIGAKYIKLNNQDSWLIEAAYRF